MGPHACKFSADQRNQSHSGHLAQMCHWPPQTPSPPHKTPCKAPSYWRTWLPQLPQLPVTSPRSATASLSLSSLTFLECTNDRAGGAQCTPSHQPPTFDGRKLRDPPRDQTASPGTPDAHTVPQSLSPPTRGLPHATSFHSCPTHSFTARPGQPRCPPSSHRRTPSQCEDHINFSTPLALPRVLGTWLVTMKQVHD